MNEKKPRTKWALAATKGVVSRISFTHDPINGTFELHDADPTTVRTGRSRERSGGREKVLLSIPSLKPGTPDTTVGAISQFDHLVAVDTNHYVIEGRTVAVAAAYAVQGILSVSAPSFDLEPLSAYVIVGVVPEVHPEKIGWHLVLTDIRHTLSRARRVLLLTDHELGPLHGKVNAREAPYYSHHLLPRNVALGYADADESAFPNVMLRHCHRFAKNVLDAIAERRVTFPEPHNGDGNFAGFFPISESDDRPISR